MTKEQRQGEYERVKERGILHRLKLEILKEFGTPEEIAEREQSTAPDKLEPAPKTKGKPKKK